MERAAVRVPSGSPRSQTLSGAWLEPWLVAGAAALFPALLFVWLLAFAARVEQLHTPALAPPHHAHQETTVNVLVTDSAALSKTARVKQIAQARGVLPEAGSQTGQVGRAERRRLSNFWPHNRELHHIRLMLQ